MDRYFDFRIIVCPDGTEIIDRRLKTAYKALTERQLIEYAWPEFELEILDDMERKAKCGSRAQTENRQKSVSVVGLRLWCGLDEGERIVLEGDT